MKNLVRVVSASDVADLDRLLAMQKMQLEQEQLKYLHELRKAGVPARITIDVVDLIQLREALHSAGRVYRKILDSVLDDLRVGRPAPAPEIPSSVPPVETSSTPCVEGKSWEEKQEE